MDAIVVNQWVAVKLDEHPKYGVSIQEGSIKDDGSFKLGFCSKEFGKKDEKVSKTVPISIRIGTKEKAIEVLEKLLAELRGEDAPPF